MQQDQLFYDVASDALASAIVAAGGYKRVAAQLWPAMKPVSAYARLKACVDETKHEKLSFDEIIALARMAKEAGNHAVMQYMAQDLGYEVRAVSPKDELESALANFDQQSERLMQAISAIQRSRFKAVA